MTDEAGGRMTVEAGGRMTDEAGGRMTTSAPFTDLTPAQLELRERAREFVDRVLVPLELEAEMADGRLAEETVETIRREAIAARLHGGRVAPSLGGQGWSMAEWFVVNETFGRVTNGLHWH